MLNDDKLWLARVRKLASQIFEKLQVVRVLKHESGKLERTTLILLADFRAWLRQAGR